MNIETAQAQAKPCPFCGDAPTVEMMRGSWGYTHDKATIGCKKCGVAFSAEAEAHSSDIGMYRIDEAAWIEVLGRWNRRPQEADHA